MTLGTHGAGRCADCGSHSPGRWPGERCYPCWQTAVAERNARVEKGPTALYRLLNDGGLLLYVGISIDPERRFGEHRKVHDWWPLVARRDVKWLPFGGLEAERAERAAIGVGQPAFNRHPLVVLPVGCPDLPEYGSWFDRAAGLREWRRWLALWRDCQLNVEERAALDRHGHTAPSVA